TSVPRRPPCPPLFPYTTLFRSPFAGCPGAGALRSERGRRAAGGSGSRREIRSPAGGGERSAPRVFPARAPFLASRYNEAHGCPRSEEHTSELQSRVDLVCRLLL